jgi:hypothetical protein
MADPRPPKWFNDRWASFSTKFPTTAWSITGMARGLSVVGATLWINTSLEQYMQRRGDELKFARELQKDLDDRHREYSKCMREMNSYQRLHGAKSTEVFKHGVLAGDGGAERINECRSMTKDYWRLVFQGMELKGSLSDDRIAELRSRHARFKSLVEPIDELDGYTDADKWVYSFPDKK